ncbi:MAG TPA: metal-dependent hydrolase [Gemmatimonadales bacterium]|nr:metal-dependent hydrolase [Gemmatimonadales bacterium]
MPLIPDPREYRMQAQEFPQARAPIHVTWLGHAAFVVASAGGTAFLIDPFLKGNPATPDSLKHPGRYRPAGIIVTHSHSDHSSDAKAVALASGAPVIGEDDFVNSLGLPDPQVMGGNVGGRFTIGDVTIHLVPAMHSGAPAGRPIGVVLTFADGRSLYHTGDTWIFGDMALIEELYHPAVILLNTGGGPYTQDPATAALAVKKYFHPDVIVPMHHQTFPGLATEEDVKQAFSGDPRLRILPVGQRASF